jgi:hypothetical protein
LLVDLTAQIERHKRPRRTLSATDAGWREHRIGLEADLIFQSY